MGGRGGQWARRRPEVAFSDAIHCSAHARVKCPPLCVFCVLYEALRCARVLTRVRGAFRDGGVRAKPRTSIFLPGFPCVAQGCTGAHLRALPFPALSEESAGRLQGLDFTVF